MGKEGKLSILAESERLQSETRASPSLPKARENVISVFILTTSINIPAIRVATTYPITPSFPSMSFALSELSVLLPIPCC